MIISKTPYRISFFGGGTDYPLWLQDNDGQVLSTTIDKSCYIMADYRDTAFETKHSVVWSHIEAVSSISEILHPAVREGLRMLKFDDNTGLNIHHVGDLPARAGIGSSSSFSVGLINCLLHLRGENPSNFDLATKAIDLEHYRLKENVGYQDQIAVAYGGFNVIKFTGGSDFKVEPLKISKARLDSLQSKLLLVFTGASRISSEVAAKMLENVNSNTSLLINLRDMVARGTNILSSDSPIDDFGDLLNEAWSLKKQLASNITSKRVDDIYNRAMESGAIGGKLLGAGGSGFMVLFVPENKQEQLASNLSDCTISSISFESNGTEIIYNN